MGCVLHLVHGCKHYLPLSSHHFSHLSSPPPSGLIFMDPQMSAAAHDISTIGRPYSIQTPRWWWWCWPTFDDRSNVRNEHVLLRTMIVSSFPHPQHLRSLSLSLTPHSIVVVVVSGKLIRALSLLSSTAATTVPFPRSKYIQFLFTSNTYTHTQDCLVFTSFACKRHEDLSSNR